MIILRALRSTLIGAFWMPETHTGKNLARRVAQLVRDKLPSDAMLITTTVDGGADFKKMARILHCNVDAAAIGDFDDFDEDDVDRATAVMSCAAHLMANALKCASDAIAADIALVRDNVTKISDSPTLLNILHDEQQRLGAPTSNPTLDVSTRFGSTFDMLDDFIQNIYRPLCSAAVAAKLDNTDMNLLMPARVEVMKKLLNAARPVRNAIKTLEGDSYVTVALIVPLYLNCIRGLGMEAGDDNVVTTYKRALQDKLKDAFHAVVDRPSLPLIATLLHPAFGHATFINDQLRDECVDELSTWHEDWPLTSARSADSLASPIGQPPSKKIVVTMKRSKDAIKEELKLLFEFFRENISPEVRNDPYYIPPSAQMQPGGEFDALTFWAQAVV